MTPTMLTTAAAQVAECYLDLPDERLAPLTGSVARGLADPSSDIDMDLYLDEVDAGALERDRRCELWSAQRAFAVQTTDGFFEKYQAADRCVDVECVSPEALERTGRALSSGKALSPDVTKVAIGIRDAVALHGHVDLTACQARLIYTHSLAAAEAATRGHSILALSALFEISSNEVTC